MISVAWYAFDLSCPKNMVAMVKWMLVATVFYAVFTLFTITFE